MLTSKFSYVGFDNIVVSVINKINVLYSLMP